MKDNKGSVVLYAVFLMMALSATAMITAFVVLTTTRFTGNSTRAASAFYAAESGIEQGLYTIKYYRDQRDTVQEAIDDINDNGTIILDNGSQYSATAENDYKTEIAFDLPVHESRQIDIFDPDTGAASLSNASSLVISWTESVSCSAISGDLLEVTLNSFTVATIASGGSTIEVYSYAASPQSLGLNPDSYKIKLKALRCDLEDVEVWVVDDVTGDYVYFENFIKITSTGEMGTASFPMQAETIWNPPLSGLGEFVLFSEEAITK